MKPTLKQRLYTALLFVVPITLFFFTREQARRQPHVLGRTWQGVSALAWSSNSQFLASSEGNGHGSPRISRELRIWNPRDGSYRVVHKEQGDYGELLQFLPNNEKIAGNSYSVNFTLSNFILDLKNGAASPTTKSLVDRLWLLSPDGKRIVFSKKPVDNVAGIFLGDLSTNKVTPLGLGYDVYGVTFSPDGSKVVTSALLSGSSTTLSIWDLKNSTRSGEIIDHYSFERRVWAFWPGNDYLARTSTDAIRIFSTTTGEELWNWKCKGAITWALSPDKTTIALCRMNDIELRMYPTMRRIRALRLPHSINYQTTLSFSPDGRTLAMGDANGFVTIWRVK